MYSHLLDSTIDEIFLSSTLPSKFISFIREAFTERHINSAVIASTDLKDAKNKLYELNNGQKYSILAVDVQTFSYLVIPDYQFSIHRNMLQQLFSDVILRIKESGISGHDLDPHVVELHRVKAELKNVFNELTMSSRIAVLSQNVDNEHFIFPDNTVLKEYYECGRKTKYATMDDAQKDLLSVNTIYSCSHCNHYHQGHEPSYQVIPQQVMEERWKVSWRRYQRV
jgi:hypothetical protein